MFIKNVPTIDKVSSEIAIKMMIESHQEAINCVRAEVKKIEFIVDLIYNKLKSSKTGRMIYCGAGTSGRIGVQDGVELFPTFGWPKNRSCFIMAGGNKALLQSVENAEDDKDEAIKKVKQINVSKFDVVICLAASGNTKFTKAIIEEAKKKEALTIAIINNKKGVINNLADSTLMLDTGNEVVLGSTRLKAGTSQKVSLNIISTMLMTRMGSVKEGEMIHMIPTNEKLRKRKKRIAKKLKKILVTKK